MGDENNTRGCVCKTLKFCSITCVFIRNNPLILCSLLFVLLLYNYFPSFFSTLIYTLPVLASTIVLVKFIFLLKHPKEQNPKKNEPVSVQDDDAKRHKNSSLRTQESKRRNANEKIRAWNTDNLMRRSFPAGGKLNRSLERKGSSSLDGGDSSSLSDYVAEKVQRRDEKPDPEEGNGFESTEEGKGGSSLDGGDSSSLSGYDAEKLQRLHEKPGYEVVNYYDDCYQKTTDRGGIELDVESPEEDEEGHEYGRKAVEWTENDQKNLMDLGTSEIERNKRLDSLIAKRRARKLMKMQVEKDLIDLSGKEQMSHIAPILIARNNLLHLPDNLDKESPVPGSAPSVLIPGRNPFDLPYDPQEEKPDLLGDSFQQEFTIAHQKEMMFCRHESFTLGAFHLGERKQEPHRTKPRALEGSAFSRFKWSPYTDDGRKPLKLDEYISHIDSHGQDGQLRERTFHGKESDVETEPYEPSDIPMRQELVEGKTDESSSSSLSEDKEHDDQANEISASDPSHVNKQVTAGSTETWVASSHLSSVDEIEAMSTEVNEISEEEIIQVGFSGVNQDSDDSMILALHPAQGALSVTEKSARDIGNNNNVNGSALHPSDGMEDLKSTGSIDAEPLATETHPTPTKRIEDKPEKLAVEENDSSTAAENLLQEPENLTTQEGNTEETKTIKEKDYSKLIRDNKGDCRNVEARSFGGEEGNVKAGSSGGDQGNVEAESFSGTQGNVEAISFSGGERNVEGGSFSGDQRNAEAGSFGGYQSSDASTSSTVEPERVFNQGAGDLVGSTAQPESAVEQISNDSSLSSSPKSVLPDKIPVDEVSPWSFNSEVHAGVQQTNMEGNSLHELLPPSFNLTMALNAQHLMEDSTVYSSNSSNYEGQQEPSNTLQRTSEANMTHSIIESLVHEKEGKEKKSVEENEDESQSTKSASEDAAAESSKPDELTISRSIEDGQERTSVNGASIGPSYDSYPTKANANSDIPSSMANEQGPYNLPAKSSEEANIVHNFNVLEVSANASIFRKEENLVEVPKADERSSSRSISDIEAESDKVTQDQAIGGASKAMGENERSISTQDTEDFERSTENGINISLEKPEDSKDTSKSVKDVEGDSEHLKGYETTIYPPRQGNLNDNLNIPIIDGVGEEFPPSKSTEANIILTEYEAEAGPVNKKQQELSDPPQPKSKEEAGIILTENEAQPGQMNTKQHELPDPPPVNSIEEANIILTEDQAEAGQMNIKQTSESIGDSEGNSQTSISQIAVVPSEAAKVAYSVTIQDTEGKSGQLMHDNYVKDMPVPVYNHATLDTIGDVTKNKSETAD